MAYLIINEHSPEEEEYTTNYIYFNEEEPGTLKKMVAKCLNVSDTKTKHKSYELLKDGPDTPLQFA